jgi:hypothetical protein
LNHHHLRHIAFSTSGLTFGKFTTSFAARTGFAARFFVQFATVQQNIGTRAEKYKQKEITSKHIH